MGRVNPMKIILIGLKYFAVKLERELNEADGKNLYIYLNIYESRIDKLRFIYHVLTCRLVYSIGGTISYNRMVNIALSLKRRVFMHWVGSDVLGAQNAVLENQFEKHFISEITHFSEISWICDELKRIGIVSRVVPFAVIDKLTTTGKFPEKFSVLTYAGNVEGFRKIYGLDTILRLAADFPEIEIRIAGISCLDEYVPANVKLLGWVDEMRAQYEDSVVFLRLADHDGNSFSVLEALSFGRYVCSKYDRTGCETIRNYPELKRYILDLKKQFDEGILKLNVTGYEFIKNNYGREKVLEELMTALGIK